MAFTTFPKLDQGSQEWLDARCGILTASVIGKLITEKTLKPAANPISRSVTRTLAVERVTKHVEQVYVNADMWRGVLDEPIARDLYSREFAPVTELGFMTRDDYGPVIGYSPDGLVGTDGLIEVKSRKQRKQFETIIQGYPPIENMAQLQCGLLVSGRKWIDYISFCGGMPMFIKRVYPDSKWFEAIIAAAKTFEANVAEQIAIYVDNARGLIPTERLEEGQEIAL